MEPARILIVEDHPAVAKGLKAVLLAEAPKGSQQIEVAHDALEAMVACESLMPHLVLMDIGLPGRSGIEATADIKAMFPSITVVMLTASDDPGDLLDALKAGASGYLLKTSNFEEMSRSILAILQGQLVIPSHLAADISGFISKSSAETAARLNDFEEIVLTFVARGVPNDIIASELDLRQEELASRIASIYSKLYITSRAEAAAEALRRGLLSD